LIEIMVLSLHQQNNNNMTPQEAKEQFILSMMDKIKSRLSAKSLSTMFMTSSCAPAHGWSVEEYLYMPTVADRLRKEGYTVSCNVNHGVTDWLIAV